jgi:hypothetical protein
VAALTRTVRSLISELELTPDDDGVPTHCVANFDNPHTLPKDAFRRRVVQLLCTDVPGMPGPARSYWLLIQPSWVRPHDQLNCLP